MVTTYVMTSKEIHPHEKLAAMNQASVLISRQANTSLFPFWMGNYLSLCIVCMWSKFPLISYLRSLSAYLELVLG